MKIPLQEWSNLEKKMIPYVVKYNKGLITKNEVEKMGNKLMIDLKNKYSNKDGRKRHD